MQEEIALFGENLGLAFQIRDDILDEISTTEELGKPVHSDKEEGKTTAYSLYGRERAEEKVKEYTEKAIFALENLHRELLIEIDKAGADGDKAGADGDNAYLFLKELAVFLASRKN